MTPVYADKPFPLVQSPYFRKGKDAEFDIFDECASVMACVHNHVVRGLNAIYLQAPHIRPADEKAFCRFIGHWHTILDEHHLAEEEDLFPAIERMAGEEGIMDVNVEQHHSFLGGLGDLGKYAAECAAGDAEYDGRKITEMIDGFGDKLAEHLADEIPSIEGLRRFGAEKMHGLKAAFDADGERNKARLSITDLSVFMTLHDVNFEDGLWSDWPPMPGLVKTLIRNVIVPWNSELVKFGAVDKSGAMRPLYAVPQDTRESL